SIALEAGTASGPGMARSFLALADAVRDSDTAAAWHWYTESLVLSEKSADQLTISRSLEAFAGLIAEQWPEQGVSVLAAADALRVAVGAARQPSEQQYLETWLSVAHEGLGASAYAAAWAAGRARGIPRTIVEVLE